jgi:antitoxin ParD1/3/4
MHVTLGPLEDFVREKVALGEYPSHSDVIRTALLLLKRRDDQRKAEVGDKIEEGMADLRAGRTIPAEEVWAKVEARLTQVESRPK